MLSGIGQGMRAFADKVGIQLLAVKNSLSQNVPSTLVFLGDLGITLDANAPVSESKMAASAEIVAGSQDPPIILISGLTRTAFHLQ
jgi:hypothetical protein